jgi:hypothetical protein
MFARACTHEGFEIVDVTLLSSTVLVLYTCQCTVLCNGTAGIPVSAAGGEKENRPENSSPSGRSPEPEPGAPELIIRPVVLCTQYTEYCTVYSTVYS